MSVTKSRTLPSLKTARRGRRYTSRQNRQVLVSDALHVLCDFLNTDFQSIDEVNRRPSLMWLSFRWASIFYDATKREQAKKLQLELKHDLSPENFRNVIDKINEMNLDHYIVEIYNDYKFLKRHLPAAFPPWQKVIKIGNERVIIKKSRFTAESLRKRLYSLLLQCIEADELGRLKCCSECQQMFIAAADRRKSVCNNCRGSHVRKMGRVRAQRLRDRKKIRKDEIVRVARYQQFVQCFAVFLKRAEGGTKSQERVSQIVKKLGDQNHLKGWKVVDLWLKSLKTGLSPAQILRTMPKVTRNILQDSFHSYPEALS